MSRLTPAELDHAERAINRNLAGQDGPRQAVCLHPDRTVTTGTDGVYVSCDYCEGHAFAPGHVPDIMPVLYTLDD